VGRAVRTSGGCAMRGTVEPGRVRGVAAGALPAERGRAPGIAYVANDSVGVEPDLPARLLGPPAPVEVFGIHEEALVEAANLLDRSAPHEKGGADGPVDSPRLVVMPGAVQHHARRAPRHETHVAPDGGEGRDPRRR